MIKKKILSLNYGLDTLIGIMAALAGMAVVQSFVFGKHYIIPTALFSLAILLGNFSYYGFQDQRWAKFVNGWIGVLVAFHLLFALFWSQRYRTVLGDSFEYVCGGACLLVSALTVQYAQRNRLW